jgi:sugar lactone lactonase YvrE
MTFAARRLTLYVLICAVLGCTTAVTTDAATPDPAFAGSPLTGSLTIPAVQPLDEGQQAMAAREAALAAPTAVAARERSRTQFVHLDSQRAAATAAATFPSLISEPAGGTPKLAPGQKITGYENPDVATLALPSGQRGLIQSAVPIARRTSTGQWTPVELHLRRSGDAYTPSSPLTDVRLPTHLAEGASLPATGLSLTPTNSNGSPLAGEGVSDGSSVFFPNTQTDSDTVLKPSVMGIDASTVLRSSDSPDQLYFHLGLPAGARVQHAPGGTSTVHITRHGSVIAVIPAPSASDAAGTPVPVTMTVRGHSVILTVDDHSSSIQYPVAVDPEFDTYVEGEALKGGEIGPWHFTPTGNGWSVAEYSSQDELEMTHKGVYTQGESGLFQLGAPGYTKIYEFASHLATNGDGKGNVYAWLSISSTDEFVELPLTTKTENVSLCAKTGCTPEGVHADGGVTYGIVTQTTGEEEFGGILWLPSIYYAQEATQHTKPAVNTSATELEYTAGGKAVKTPNVIENKNAWLSPSTGAIELETSDGGLGVAEQAIEMYGPEGWETAPNHWYGTQDYLNHTSTCKGVQCTAIEHQVVTYESLEREGGWHLTDGETRIRAVGRSAMPGSQASGTEYTIKVAKTPPHNIVLSGLRTIERKESGNEVLVYQLGETEAHLKAEASDGEKGISPGIKSIALYINGREIGKAGGSCPIGPCTASTEWALNGAELGAGEYPITVIATDNAGNTASYQVKLAVHHASPEAMGPGSVNPESGDFALESTDVNLSGGQGPLTVQRHYDSLNTTEGAEGPLGPQWTLGLGGLAKLEVMPNGAVLIAGPEGLTAFNVKEGGGYEAPEGDTNLTLQYEPKKPAYIVTDPTQGTSTEFTLPTGAKAWLPTVSKGPAATNQITDEYRTIEPEVGKTIVQPTLELAPHPTATCTRGALEDGCRALEFAYYEGETTAGETKATWGAYKNRLKEITAIAYNPATGKMTPTPVALYTYDKQGRMRTERNPQIPGSETIYGYDSENHVTAFTPPGQGTWTFTYGTTPGDPKTGRLIKVYQGRSLWNGNEPTNSALPALSGTPQTGVKMGVTTGTWANSPVSYGFQWQDCNAEGAECTPILGATNANYTPVDSDVGHRLAVKVNATNGWGSVTKHTEASTRVVALGAPKFAGQLNKWETVEKFHDPAFSTPSNYAEEYWVSDTASNEVGLYASGGTLVREFSVNKPKGIAAVGEHDLWIVESAKDEVREYSETGEYLGKHFGAPGGLEGDFNDPSGIAVSPYDNDIFVADTGNNRIERFTGSGEWISTASEKESGDERVPFSEPVGVMAFGEDVWVTDTGDNRVVALKIANSRQMEQAAHFGKLGSGKDVGKEPEFNHPTGITHGAYSVEFEGNKLALIIADTGNNRIQTVESELLPTETDRKEEHPVLQEWGTKGTGNGEFDEPQGVAYTGLTKKTVHVADTGNNRIQIFNENEKFTEAKYSTSFGLEGATAGTLVKPTDEAIDSKGNLWVLDETALAIDEFSSTGVHIKTWPVISSQPEGISVDKSGHIWVLSNVYLEPKVEEYSEAGEVLTRWGTYGTGTGELREPHCLAADGNGHVWVCGYHHIQEFNEKGEELATEFVENANNLAVDGKGHLWATQGGTPGKVREYTEQGAIVREFGQEGSGAGQIGYATGIAVDAAGNVWISDDVNHRVDVFYENGEYETEFGLKGTGEGEFEHPSGVAIAPNGAAWVLDEANKVAEQWTQTPPTEGAAQPAQPGITIEYNVPLEGSLAPYQMGTNPETKKPEPERWGQTDDPEYATAVFSANDPQTWPASTYKNADSTVQYLDPQARTVNIATPSGGISTTEYNEDGAVMNALSPDNRAAALENSKPAEAAQLLSTKSVYNTEGQLTGTWGPQHMVKLAVGKSGSSEETLARSHVSYTYNAGAKEVEEKTGEKYDLVTMTVTGAETPNGEEFDKRTVTDEYGGQSNLGWKLRKPTATIGEPATLHLTTTTTYEEKTGNIIETKTPAATGGEKTVAPAYQAQFGTAGKTIGDLEEPRGTAIAPSGNVYVLDTGNGNILEYSPAGSYLAAFGTPGSGTGQLKSPYAMAEDAKGDLWVADSGNDRVEEFNTKHEAGTIFGKEGAGAGQFKEPKGIAIAANGNIFVTDAAQNRVEKFNEKGEFVSAFGFGVSNGENKLETCTTTCEAGLAGSGPGELSSPRGITVSSSGNVWVLDFNNDRINEYTEAGGFQKAVGAKGTGLGQFEEPKGLTIDPAGNLWVSETKLNRIQELSATGTPLTTFGIAGAGPGQFSEPWGMAFTSASSMFIADVKNNRIERWVPTFTGNQGAYDTKTYYYTAKNEAEVSACREHADWVGLPCEITHVNQPGGTLPELPVTVVTYNMWDEPATTVETVGKVKREKETKFDAAGRPLSTTETSSIDTAVPKITDTYNSENGTLELQTTSVGETNTGTITQHFNTLGQLSSYTDSTGNTATFEYEPAGEARLTKISDTKGNQKYTYNETTGTVASLADSGAGTFAVARDLEGHVTSETLPNGMTANTTYNPVGTATNIEYIKTTHCTSSCTWLADSIVPGIHGETLKQASTLSEEPSYTYDGAGRLTSVQEIPAGEGCKTRLYSYAEDSERTMETKREPTSEGKCATEGGTSEWHTYDSADRLTDPNVKYEEFGNITALPTPDAGEHEITSSYYVDGQVATQTQNKETIEYKLDPNDRTSEAISSGTTAGTNVLHYDGPGSAVAWIAEGSEQWTRNIPGIDGTLTATQKGHGTTGEQPVLLLHDLSGNVVAEAADNETETKLLHKYNSTEFGTPTGKEAPPKYSWLGAGGVANELPAGPITQDGVTYVPQLGAGLQTAGVPPLPVPAFEGTAFVSTLSASLLQAGLNAAAHAVARYEEAQAVAAGGPESGHRPGLGQSEALQGGCTGTRACAAANYQCTLQSLFGEPEQGILWLGGRVYCNRPVSGIALEMCMYAWSPHYERYEKFRCNGPKQKGVTKYNTTQVREIMTEVCALGLNYKAWVWGHAWSSGFWFVGPGMVSGAWTCEDDYAEGDIEFAEFLNG